MVRGRNRVASLVQLNSGRKGDINFKHIDGCCQTESNQSLQGQVRYPLYRTELAPLGQSGGTALLEILSEGKAALRVEMIGDRGVDRGENLQT